MFRKGVLFAAILFLNLSLSLRLAAANGYYAYEPHYLHSVEDASNQVKFLSPHFAPMEVLKKVGGTTIGLTSGYSLVSADVNQLGINLSFSKSGVIQDSKWFWSWGGGYSAPISTPYKDDIVTSVPFADIKYFEIQYINQKGMPAPWCVAPQGTGLGPKNWICVVTERDAEGLVDALATLVIASGGSLETSPGVYMGRRTSAKDLQKHPALACTVGYVLTNGPSQKAGIQVGDVLQSFNGKSCTGEEDFRDALRKGNGQVHIEALRKGQPLALDLHYANPDAAAAQLLQKTSAASRHPVGSVVSLPEGASAAPPSAPRFGFQVRTVTDVDVSQFNLPKPMGLLVVSVDKGGLAEGAGVLSGDVILEVNDSEINDLDLFKQLLQSGVARKFRVWRKGQALDLSVPQNM